MNEYIVILQQDAANKITVEIELSKLLYRAKSYFRWRKDISLSRINSLGTSKRDSFIQYLKVIQCHAIL